MGRIKTAQIKRITKQLMKEHSAEFSQDFTKNKLAVSKYTDIESTKIRNTVAGYASRLVRQGTENTGPKKSMHKEDLSQYY